MAKLRKSELAAIDRYRARYWREWRRSFRTHQLEVRPRNGATPGFHAVEAYHPDHPAPLGIVWWKWGAGNDEVEVVNSYTFPDLRRLGIRTHLHEYMIEWLRPRVILTGYHSTREAIAWMEKVGYKLDRKRGVWRYEVRKRR